MIHAIGRELILRQPYLQGEPIKSIYFGGGTPSLLTTDELEHLLRIIYNTFTVGENCEITLEANPDDLSFEKLSGLRTSGINRLSIGIQSFDDTILSFLNRAHNGSVAKESLLHARKAGFSNISVDLIYAIPGQPMEQWERNIDEALRYTPEHISAYSLTVEEKTVFGNWLAKGKLHPAPDETAAAELELLMEKLEQHGYEQYEVSNFARPGFLSFHNSNYWKGAKYLGVGPSAHSYNRLSRQFNVASNAHYLKAIGEDRIPYTLETLTAHDRINEYLLTSLRTTWGVNLNMLESEFGYSLLHQRASYIESLISNKLAVIRDDFLILTKAGRLLADKISSDLFLIP